MTARPVPVLPRQDDRNGWLQILPPLPPATRLTGAVGADYAVVGGGFAGLSAARRLAELNPDARIALIEAGRIGNNPAGRCSGFAIDQAHNLRASDFAGALQAECEQLALNRAGQDYLRQVVQAEDIACDWSEDGKIHAAGTARGAGQLDAYRKHLDLLNLPYTVLSARDMRETTGSNFYATGLHTPGTILLQPAALVAGLARTMPGNVTIYEDSPVTATEWDQTHRLTTPDGTLSAPIVILANNGFAKQFGLVEGIIPMGTYGSLSRALTAEEQAALGGKRHWGIIPADAFGTSVRRIGDRILIRNIYSYEGEMNPAERTRRWAARKHLKSFRNRFPMLPKVTLDFTWGGALALSRNGAPVWGRLGERIFAACCMNGVGIARGTIHGKLLAEEICGVTSDLGEIMRRAERPSPLPPKPLLGIGAELTFAMRRLRAGREL
ncbi:MAG: FAD-binding oxidoreductase [Pseudomonadota bacterium]